MKITESNDRHGLNDGRKKEFKRELLEIFRRYGYMTDEKDHEVTFRTTSGRY